MRIAGIVKHSLVDGPGVRYVVFTQGCPHGCKSCHNPETHDFSGGKEITPEKIIEEIDNTKCIDGVTLSGGDPFCQAEECLEIAKAVHNKGLSVWAYSGYTYEIIRDGGVSEAAKKLLEEIDVLVDGPFVEEKKSDKIMWRGSSNQRLIWTATGDIMSEDKLKLI